MVIVTPVPGGGGLVAGVPVPGVRADARVAVPGAPAPECEAGAEPQPAATKAAAATSGIARGERAITQIGRGPDEDGSASSVQPAVEGTRALGELVRWRGPADGGQDRDGQQDPEGSRGGVRNRVRGLESGRGGLRSRPGADGQGGPAGPAPSDPASACGGHAHG